MSYPDSLPRDPSDYLRGFADHWWVPLIQGIAGIVFGILAILFPGPALGTLLVFFGAFAVVYGVMAVIFAFRRKGRDDQWWAWLVDGLLGIAIGLMALFWPAATALAFVIWIAAWAIVGGVMRIIVAIRLRREIDGEWALILSGVLSVVFGLLIAVLPAAGLVTITWLIGFYAILFGALLVWLSLRIRDMRA